MRNIFAVALVCLLFLSLAAGQESGTAKSPKTKTKTATASGESRWGSDK